jgi:hypothetical protein
VFKGDSADMCAGKFPLVSMGGRADRKACADGERGPPSARAEIFFIVFHMYENASKPYCSNRFYNWPNMALQMVHLDIKEMLQG